jgi:hypothetical protein
LHKLYFQNYLKALITLSNNLSIISIYWLNIRAKLLLRRGSFAIGCQLIITFALLSVRPLSVSKISLVKPLPQQSQAYQEEFYILILIKKRYNNFYHRLPFEEKDNLFIINKELHSLPAYIKANLYHLVVEALYIFYADIFIFFIFIFYLITESD